MKSVTKLRTVLFVTLFTGIFFRCFDYFNRIHFLADSTLFSQAAYYAFSVGKIPQIGPFAQGPFFTGPWWLWILETTYIFQLGRFTPWYFSTLLSILFIVLIYYAGNKIGGYKVGLLAAIFAAISPLQINNSFDVWNAMADPFIGTIAILLTLKFYETKKIIFAFLLSFSISLAVSIHFQAFFLFPLILVAIFTTRPNIKIILAMFVGGIIPLIPFLYFDVRFHWFETRRIYDYLTVIQYRMYVPNRWLNYAGKFWPENWANIIGGNVYFSYLIIILTALFSFLKLKAYKVNRNYFLVAIAFLISVIMLRYYRGERQFYYTNYAHAFVLLLTSWSVIQVYRFKKFVGIALAVLILYFTVKVSVEQMKPPIVTYGQIRKLVDEIYQKFPERRFTIYECPDGASFIATSVAYEIYFDKKDRSDGIKIGVCFVNDKISWRPVADSEIDKPYMYQNKSSPWVYTQMAEWWVKNPPGKSLY